MTYAVNEVFYSLQGEGVRAGTPNVFVRFSGCNLQCNGAMDGEAYQPVCDTEFISNVRMKRGELLETMRTIGVGCRSVIFTGGEPTLQVDQKLVDEAKAAGWHIAMESNGTKAPPSGIDWLTISPKTAEHTLQVERCSEVKYVRQAGQGIPKTRIEAEHYLISPAFDHTGQLNRETLRWCIDLVKSNPKWRLSVQQHKAWIVR